MGQRGLQTSVHCPITIQHTATQVASRVWPQPGNEPLIDVDRAVLVAVYHQATVRTAIHPFPEGHVLLPLASTTHPGRITLIYDREFFPKAQTLVDKHLHKAVEPPVIIYHAIANLPLAPVFGGFVFLLLDDHLPLGKIADHHSPVSQSVRDEMGGFMQTVLLFLSFALSLRPPESGEVGVPGAASSGRLHIVSLPVTDRR